MSPGHVFVDTTRRLGAAIAMVALVLAISGVRSPVPVLAAAPGAQLQLSMPGPPDQSITYTQGPHNWAATGAHPWNSLDLVPAGGHVYAARAGTAYVNDCGVGAVGLIRIDHGGGYMTTYYHVTNMKVTQGQHVERGQWIADIGTNLPCGGSANGAHVHFSLWYVPSGSSFNFSDTEGVDLNGVAIGNWKLADGASQGSGCMTSLTSGSALCPSLTSAFTNDLPSEQITTTREPAGDTEDVLVRGNTLAGWDASTTSTGTPYPWFNMGGGLKGSPTGIYNSDSSVFDVFAIGLDDHVYWRRWTWSGGWVASWKAIPTSGSYGVSGLADTEMVNVTRSPNGNMELFIRGPAGDVQRGTLSGSGLLLGWESLGGAINGTPSARWSTDGTREDLFAIGTDGHPRHRSWIPRIGWQVWSGALSGTAATAGAENISVVRAPDNTIDLFIRGTDNAAWRGHADNAGNILSWTSLGGTVRGAPDAKWNNAGTRLDVFAIGSTDLPYQNTLSGGAWSGWKSVSPYVRWG